MFPVGSLSKPAVRAEARRLGLRSPTRPTARRSASSPTATTRRLSRSRHCLMRAAAPSSTSSGRTLGSHAGRASIHDRPAQGSRHRDRSAALRPEDRRRLGRRDRRTTCGARAHDADGVRRELGVGRCAGRLASACRRRSVIAIAPAAGASAHSDGRRAEFEFDDPQAAVTPGPGGRLLRRRRRRRRRLDRVRLRPALWRAPSQTRQHPARCAPLILRAEYSDIASRRCESVWPGRRSGRCDTRCAPAIAAAPDRCAAADGES